MDTFSTSSTITKWCDNVDIIYSDPQSGGELCVDFGSEDCWFSEPSVINEYCDDGGGGDPDPECYLPPIPNVTNIKSNDATITAPSNIPEGWVVDLIFRDISNNGSEIAIKENVTNNESFTLSQLEVIVEPGKQYGLKWRPVELE